MATLQTQNPKRVSGEKALDGRLFVLDASGGRIFTANADGSDAKLIHVNQLVDAFNNVRSELVSTLYFLLGSRKAAWRAARCWRMAIVAMSVFRPLNANDELRAMTVTAGTSANRSRISSATPSARYS